MLAPADIHRARTSIAGHVHDTPTMSCRRLGEQVGVSLSLKCESFQKTGSFKARGALNKLLTLGDRERAVGLITVSAGNHAAAVAWAASLTETKCRVVMPADAPPTKIEAVRGYGAEILLHDDRGTLFERLRAEQQASGATFVHPFDDVAVLAGAGTVGLELLDAVPDLDVVVVPVGGGGLLGGVATAVHSVRPTTRIVAVELAEGPGLAPALAAGKPVPVDRPKTLADGLTPPFVGGLPLKIAREHVDAVVGVTEAEILAAMHALMTTAKLYVEASGAAATAAVLSGRIGAPTGARVGAIVSGGNLDLAALRRTLA